MVKKIFSLVMVMSILGGILAGCSKPAEEETPTTSTTTSTTTEAE